MLNDSQAGATFKIQHFSFKISSLFDIRCSIFDILQDAFIRKAVIPVLTHD